MADEDKNRPILQELFGHEGGQAQIGSEGSGRSLVGPVSYDAVEAALYRMHETRLVRSAGRMVAGSKMATPAAQTAERRMAGRGVVPVCVPVPERRGGLGFSGKAVAIACVVGVGATAALTSSLGPSERSSVRTALHRDTENLAGDVTGALPSAEPVQALAISPAPLVTRRTGSRPAFIRIAQKDAPGLEVADVFGPAGKPIHLEIGLNGAPAEEYSFLMFRGLPPKVTLSAGFRLKESWAVSLRDLESLALEAPGDFQGTFNLEVLLIKGRDTPAESRVVSVEIVPSDIQLPATAAIPQSAPGPQVLTAAPRTVDQREGRLDGTPPAQPPRSRSTIPPAEEEAMMARANTLLGNNDVMSARLIYEHLANSGSAKAALAMGKTYDPSFFQTIEAAGVRPEIDKARDWYSRAAELGNPEAANRLASLASR